MSQTPPPAARLSFPPTIAGTLAASLLSAVALVAVLPGRGSGDWLIESLEVAALVSGVAALLGALWMLLGEPVNLQRMPLAIINPWFILAEGGLVAVAVIVTLVRLSESGSVVALIGLALQIAAVILYVVAFARYRAPFRQRSAALQAARETSTV